MGKSPRKAGGRPPDSRPGLLGRTPGAPDARWSMANPVERPSHGPQTCLGVWLDATMRWFCGAALERLGEPGAQAFNINAAHAPMEICAGYDATQDKTRQDKTGHVAGGRPTGPQQQQPGG
ncbi:hypothetical protein VDGL01_08282 [Verticillium dahliae]